MTRARDISRLLGRTDNEVDSEGEIIASSGQIVDSAFVLSQTPAPATFQFYTTLDSLPSSPDAGALAFVEANTRMYLNDGNGWYSIAAVNLSPSLTLSPSGTIVLATDGSPSTVTITATDTDDPSAILSYSVESDGNMKATGTTVTQDSSVFTITPITEADGGVAGTFTLSFKVSDQIDEAVANKSFSITFSSIDSLTGGNISRTSTSTTEMRLYATGYSNGTTFPYTITGVTSADTSTSLSGNMVYNSSTGYAPLTITGKYDTGTPLSLGGKTGTLTVGGLTKNFSVTPPYNFKQHYIQRRDYYYSGSYADTNFGNERGFIMWDLDGNYSALQTIFNNGGNAGSQSYYRSYRAVKIYGYFSGVMRHLTTFSWDATSTEMYCQYFTSGSVQGLRITDDGNTAVCTRDYEWSGISNNYSGYIAGVEFFSNEAATTRINTVLSNGYSF